MGEKITQTLKALALVFLIGGAASVLTWLGLSSQAKQLETFKPAAPSPTVIL